VACYIYRTSKETDYNTVFWMGASAVVFTPVGVLVLRLAPERMLMLIVSCFLIAVTLFNLLVGSFTFRESRRNSVVAGGLSGLTGGAVGLYGPPAMIYLLGIYRNPLVARSTAFVFLSVESLILGANYWVYKNVHGPRSSHRYCVRYPLWGGHVGRHARLDRFGGGSV